MPFICYICQKKFTSCNDTISHLKNFHYITDNISVKFSCLASTSCSKKFSTYCSLRKHSKICTSHVNTSPVPQSTNVFFNPHENINISNDISTNNNHEHERIVEIPNFEPHIDKLLTSLNSLTISRNQIKKIHDSVGNFISELTNHYILTIKSKKETNVEEVLKLSGKVVTNIIKKNGTSYKINKSYSEKPLYVPPIEKYLSDRWETKFDTHTNRPIKKLIQNTYQYVSIIETLKALFKIPGFYNNYFLKDHICDSSKIKGFCCAKLFLKNNFYNENTIRIQLFFDEFEICNPLGSKASIHKIGAIYFRIKNISREFLSKLNNIYLVSLFHSEDLKSDNINLNEILSPIVNELKLLESVGLDISHSQNVKGTLESFVFDNLGGNTVFGFVQSFAAKYFCRICIMSKHDTQIETIEKNELLRNLNDYKKYIEIIKNTESIDFKLTKGVKTYCILNELKHFNIFDNASVDIMHDMLEGTVPFLLRSMFTCLIENKMMTLEQINRKIKFFFFGILEQQNIHPLLFLKKKI